MSVTMKIRDHDTAGPYYQLFDNLGAEKNFQFKGLKWYGTHYSENEGVYAVELDPGIFWLIINEINEVHLVLLVVAMTKKVEEQILLFSFVPPFDTRETVRQKLRDVEVPRVVKRTLAGYLPLCKGCEYLRSIRLSKTFDGLERDFFSSCERF